jgi:hypothetical protein
VMISEWFLLFDEAIAWYNFLRLHYYSLVLLVLEGCSKGINALMFFLPLNFFSSLRAVSRIVLTPWCWCVRDSPVWWVPGLGTTCSSTSLGSMV